MNSDSTHQKMNEIFLHCHWLYFSSITLSFWLGVQGGMIVECKKFRQKISVCQSAAPEQCLCERCTLDQQEHVDFSTS